MQFHLNCTLLTSGGLCTLLLFINVPAFSKHCRLLSFTSVLAQKQIDLKSMLGVYIVLIGGVVLAFITYGVFELQVYRGGTLSSKYKISLPTRKRNAWCL